MPRAPDSPTRPPTPDPRPGGLRRVLLRLGLAAAGLLAAGPAAAQIPRGSGQVRGVVSSPGGEALVGISIVLQPMSRADLVYATSTDDEGRYSLNGLVAGQYRIRADGQGFLTARKEDVRVQPPFRTIIDFAMAPAEPALDSPAAPAEGVDGVMHAVQGSLVNENGEPVLEGSVILERRGAAGAIYYARTDPDGRFEFTELPAGRYDVTTRSPGLIPLHLIDRTLPAGDTLYVQLVAPRYPLAFKGWLDDLLPPEVAVPPPSPRRIELGPHGVAPLGPAPPPDVPEEAASAEDAAGDGPPPDPATGEATPAKASSEEAGADAPPKPGPPDAGEPAPDETPSPEPHAT